MPDWAQLRGTRRTQSLALTLILTIGMMKNNVHQRQQVEHVAPATEIEPLSGTDLFTGHWSVDLCRSYHRADHSQFL